MKNRILFLIIATAASINCTEILNEKINFNIDKKASTPYTLMVENKYIGDIDISTHDQNTISIDILKETTTKERLQKLEVKVNQANQKVSLEVINNNKKNKEESSWQWFSGWFNFNSHSANGKSDRVDLTIKIPKDCIVDVDINNGNIKLENIDRPISLKSNLGSIDINKADSTVSIDSNNGKLNLNNIKGFLKVKSNLGNLKIANIENGVDANITNGDVKINNAKGPLDVSVTQGSIDLRQTQLQDSGEINFDTTVGSINLYLPTKQDASIRARTTLGPIEINNRKRCSQFRVGNSFNGPLISDPNSRLKISLKTTNGSINVNTQRLP